ncbi:ATP-binding cassette domain-containing protein [Kribbella sp. NPDC051770]|uniref:ATP-binding cassette domain-containing protein n=1 Tax=Kribbella sp. NPDC051770 TaxID=3155413 RepID=UPI00343670AC
MTAERVIVADDVRKNYPGGTEGAGLNGFDLEVGAGSVVGLLGPNGAGKTTAVRILSTLLDLDSGVATVAGYDVRRQGQEVRKRIGLVGQYAAVDEILTGRQNLVLFGRLNHLSRRAAAQRADELLDRFALHDAADQAASKYSGGMRRRLDLAASLIVAPALLFVDEPTTGLDPAGRREVWSAVRDLVRAGTTVLLTTQYLEEADQLADRISMLKAGKVVAEGTPDQLKAQLGGDWLDLVLADPGDVPVVLGLVERLAEGEIRVDDLTVSVPVKDRTRALVDVATALRDVRIEPEDITLRRPTLDEVFLHLTGAEVAA